MAGEETGVVVELDGLVVGFGDGEGDGGEAEVSEVVDTVLEECEAEALPAIGAGDAELGDVSDVAGYAGAEKHSDDGSAAFVAEDPGCAGIEDSAAGEADDVVEETEGAVEGAVLVVDAGVDVVEIRLMDELGGCLVVVGGPAEEFDVRGQRGWGRNLRCVRGREVVLEEETGVHGESGGEKGFVDGAGVVEEELGFDALDVGRMLEELEKLVEEGLCDREGLRGVAVGGKSVADYGFLAFVDAEGEAADAAAVEGDKAGEDAGVEILEEEFGGALVVPAEALLPEARLCFEQRAQLTRGKMTQVEDFELGSDGHTLFEVLELSL